MRSSDLRVSGHRVIESASERDTRLQEQNSLFSILSSPCLGVIRGSISLTVSPGLLS